jgi:hypothetical protein
LEGVRGFFDEASSSVSSTGVLRFLGVIGAMLSETFCRA